MESTGGRGARSSGWRALLGKEALWEQVGTCGNTPAHVNSGQCMGLGLPVRACGWPTRGLCPLPSPHSCPLSLPRVKLAPQVLAVPKVLKVLEVNLVLLGPPGQLVPP